MEWEKKRIKQLRRAMRLTQKGFGERLGVTMNAVESWEQGLRRPDLYNQRRLDDMKVLRELSKRRNHG